MCTNRCRAATRGVLIVLVAVGLNTPLLSAQQLTYSTYLAGATAVQGFPPPITFPATTTANAVAIDGAGNVYVVGFTNAIDFPITPGAYDAVMAQPHSRCCGPFSWDEFLAKLSPSGQLLYSTFLGPGLSDGNFETFGSPMLAVDSAGNAYVASTGTSCDDCQDSVVTIQKLDPKGSKLLYSTAFNLDNFDADLVTASGVAVDNSGHLYIAGNIGGSYFTPNPPGNRIGSQVNCYIVKLDTNQSGAPSIVYQTFLGASPGGFQNPPNDTMGGIAIDAGGNAYITGTTASATFPHTAIYGAGTGGAFIMKLDATGSSYTYSALVAGVSLGASVFVQSTTIALDASDNAYITGAALAAGFPVTKNASQLTFGGGESDAFLLKLTPGGHLAYSTYIGGIGVDVGTSIGAKAGYVAVAGYTTSPDFPVSTDAVQSTFQGVSSDAFLSVRHKNGRSIYSTFVGGSGADQATGTAIDTGSTVHVVGTTTSVNFPVTSTGIQTTLLGLEDGFLSKETLH